MNTIAGELAGKNVLIFDNQAGGGHRITSSTIKEYILENKGHPLVKDVLNDVLGKKISSIFYNHWNEAMKTEDVEKLKNIPKMQPIGEFFLWLPEFFCTLWWLLAHKVDAVVNPQPAGLHAISKAVRVANFINKYILNRKDEILIFNLITELPTEYTSDFFNTYRRLSDGDRRINRLITLKPMINPGETETDFWKKHTGFDMKEHIIYDEFPLRSAFLEYAEINPKEITNLKIEIKSDEAVKLLNEVSVFPNEKLSPGVISIELQEKDSVYSMLLGSQAAQAATLKYVNDFIQLNKKNDPKNNRYLFVFCGDCTSSDEQKSLFEQVCNLIKSYQENNHYPKNTHVIPLEIQTGEYVAPIFRKSQMTLTRSGGVTAIELNTLSSGQICIHSNHEDLMTGMPDWEAGNALYLQRFKHARVVAKNMNPFEDLKWLSPEEADTK